MYLGWRHPTIYQNAGPQALPSGAGLPGVQPAPPGWCGRASRPARAAEEAVRNERACRTASVIL